MLESRTPRSQSSARQFGSQPSAARSTSVRTKTVLPPSGMNPFCACRCSRERNQKKYSRQLRRLYQLEWKLISWTPPCTTSAPVVREGVVDVGEQFGMDLVLGVEDPDDVAAAVRQRRVHGLRLVLLLVGVDDDPDARIAVGGLLGDGGGLRIVVSDDHDDLEVGVGRGQQPLDGVVEHGLLVPRGQEQRERHVLVAVGPAEPGGGEYLRRTPGMHLPPERERRHPEKCQ